jgi:hypothetical protein
MGEGKKSDAIVEISQQISYSVTAEAFDTLSQKMIDGMPEDYNSYAETVKGKSELLVGGRVKKLNDSVFYLCRADAAIPYLDSLMIYLKSKLKAFAQEQRAGEESCKSAGEIYLKTLGWQRVAEHLGQMDKALQKEYDRTYAKIEKECRCSASQLHWSAGSESAYSEAAFARLSRKLKIEKSPCSGKGISLNYRDESPACKKEASMVHSCLYKANLSIASCDGREYSLLSSGKLEGVKTSEEYALADLRDVFESAGFWKKWEQELKKWRPPECEQ